MTTPLVTRAQAGLVPPKRRPPTIASEGLTAHYGGPSPWGSKPDRSTPARFYATADHSRCASIWRAWQSFHMRPVSAGGRGWQDIAYNSGVCPHGSRFEGRGPGVRSGANGTNDGNKRSCATCYIAGDADPLTDQARRAFGDEFVRLSPARWQHGDWKPTACAGLAIRAWQRAGWPIPGTPAPGPQPTPDPEVPDVDKWIVYYLHPDGGSTHAYIVGGMHAKFLVDQTGIDRAKRLGVPELNSRASAFGRDWQHTMIIVDGPCANV